MTKKPRQPLRSYISSLISNLTHAKTLFPQFSEWLETTLAEHANIVKAIKAHEGEEAEKAMKAHLRFACEHAVKQFLPVDFF